MTKNINFSKISKSFFLGLGMIVLTVLVMSAPKSAMADTLYRQLELGMTGSDISALQSFLAQDSTLYPEGLVTGYYGSLTKSAVARFQLRNGIASVGRVGPATLPVLNLQMLNGTSLGVDVYAPAITSINLGTTNTTATINWTTSDLARGKVYYSTSSLRLNNTFDDNGINFVEPTVSGNMAQSDGLARTSQSVYISGLSPNTVYFYLVKALDSSNNVSLTLPAYFQTKQ